MLCVRWIWVLLLATPAFARPDDAPDPGKILLIGAVSATNKELRPGAVMAVRPDGTGLERLVEFDGADIRAGRASRDGRRLALSVVDKEGHQSLWLVGPDGKRRQLPRAATPRGWSPDGTSVAAFRVRDGGWENLLIDAATGAERRLDFPTADAVEGWTPDGQRLVVAAGNPDRFLDTPRGRYPKRGLYTVGPDGKGRRELTSEPEFDQIDACFSPDGGRLVHFRRENPDERRVLHAGVVRGASGRDPRQYVQFDALIDALDTGHTGKPHGPPCWSPDGREVLWVLWHYRRERGGDRSLEYYDLVFTSPEKGRPRRVGLYGLGIVFVGDVEWVQAGPR